MKISLHSLALALFAGAAFAVPFTTFGKEPGETLIAMEAQSPEVKFPEIVVAPEEKPQVEATADDTSRKVNVQIEIPVPAGMNLDKTQIPITVEVQSTLVPKSTVAQVPVNADPIETSEGNVVAPAQAETKTTLPKSGDIIVEVKTGNTETSLDTAKKFVVKHPFKTLAAEVPADLPKAEKTETETANAPVVVMVTIEQKAAAKPALDVVEPVAMQLPEIPAVPIMTLPGTPELIPLPEVPVMTLPGTPEMPIIMQIPETKVLAEVVPQASLPIVQLPERPPLMQLPELPAVMPLPETPVIMQLPELPAVMQIPEVVEKTIVNELKKAEITDPVANLVASQVETNKKFVVKHPFKPLSDEKIPEEKILEKTDEKTPEEKTLEKTDEKTPAEKTLEEKTPVEKTAEENILARNPLGADILSAVKETLPDTKLTEVTGEIPTPIKEAATEVQTEAKTDVKETVPELKVETTKVDDVKTEVKSEEKPEATKFVVKHPFKDLTKDEEKPETKTPVVASLPVVETTIVKSTDDEKETETKLETKVNSIEKSDEVKEVKTPKKFAVKKPFKPISRDIKLENIETAKLQPSTLSGLLSGTEVNGVKVEETEKKSENVAKEEPKESTPALKETETPKAEVKDKEKVPEAVPTLKEIITGSDEPTSELKAEAKVSSATLQTLLGSGETEKKPEEEPKESTPALTETETLKTDELKVPEPVPTLKEIITGSDATKAEEPKLEKEEPKPEVALKEVKTDEVKEVKPDTPKETNVEASVLSVLVGKSAEPLKPEILAETPTKLETTAEDPFKVLTSEVKTEIVAKIEGAAKPEEIKVPVEIKATESSSKSQPETLDSKAPITLLTTIVTNTNTEPLKTNLTPETETKPLTQITTSTVEQVRPNTEAVEQKGRD